MRFDHAVIGVADLDAAVAAYRALGFVVRPGGRHTGEGTHNAIVRFGLDYLELMAVHDPAIARDRPFGGQLLEFLDGRDGGLIGYVVAAVGADDLALAMRRSGLDAVGPLAMQRERPDGNVLRWRLLFPRGPRWRDTAPFVVEWATSDDQRVAWDAPVPHPNGITHVAALAILADDLPQASAMYEAALGLGVSEMGPHHRRVALGDMPVDLIQTGTPAAARGLEGLGEGLAEVTLRVGDLGQAARVIPGLERDRDGIRWLIPPQSALGARLVLAEVSAPGS